MERQDYTLYTNEALKDQRSKYNIKVQEKQYNFEADLLKYYP